MSKYVSELIEQAEMQLRAGRQLSPEMSVKIVAQLKSLHNSLQRQSEGENSHRCVRCLHLYTPLPEQSEDCPLCGCAG